jgi:hypothetical protein
MNPSYYLALVEAKRLVDQQFEPAAPHPPKRAARTRRAWRGWHGWRTSSRWIVQPVRRLRPQPTS